MKDLIKRSLRFPFFYVVFLSKGNLLDLYLAFVFPKIGLYGENIYGQVDNSMFRHISQSTSQMNSFNILFSLTGGAS